MAILRTIPMTQAERNRLALTSFGTTKALGIVAVICAYTGTYSLGIGCFVLAGISLITCVALCLINLRLQAKEEWTS